MSHTNKLSSSTYNKKIVQNNQNTDFLKISRQNKNNFEQNQDIDEFDALKSQELKKSNNFQDKAQQIKNQQHEQRVQQVQHGQQNQQNQQNNDEKHEEKQKDHIFEASESKITLKEIHQALSKNQREKPVQNNKINRNETFSEYMKHMQDNIKQSKSKLNSPILRSLSYQSLNSSNIYYQPQLYSMNLSRVYVPNFKVISNPSIKEQSSKQEIENRLKQIYEYYSETYLQMNQKYETFDSANNKNMNFQSFSLFCKDFKILKVIFSMETIKKVYKKYSQFGKRLKFTNFLNLIEALAHQKDARDYFKLEILVPSMNQETRNQLQIQQFYTYLGIYENKKYRQKFSRVFNPFGCQKAIQIPKIKYKYRKFSEPQLHKKALPQPKQHEKNKKQQKIIVLKMDQKFQPSPFDQAKSIVVSWQMFRSKSISGSIQSLKKSTQAVKKYVKQDPEDKIYLKQYKDINKKSLQRSTIQKKISQIQKLEKKKANDILNRINDRIMKTKMKL